ncbi:MAG: ribosome biogenesis GTPase Der [Firmicutes bacterium CAG:552_39_19]|nr:MAG: ribosome biogenesis GTPase Der [Firmicutes bacterium CAG:552_39_19]
MTKPLVAVVGRPNVGKSTFFNRICGKRISIVKDLPGVTRDRIYADAEWQGYNFTLIDTGGIELKSDDAMYKHIRKQVEIAVDVADVIVFFVDGKQGLVASDMDVADYLRTVNKPVVLAVNKLDNFTVENMDAVYDFYQLGLGEPIGVSAEQSKGLGDLLDEIVKYFDKIESDESDSIKIAVVGRPNVGKSSMVNKILGYERVIVSDVAGTTRDAVDTPFTRNDKNYTIIDTAGLRRKRGVEFDTVESYSVMRSIAAIKRADVVLIIFDSSEEISEQDVRIAGIVHEEGKPCIIVMNKWDVVEKDTHTIEDYKKTLDNQLAFMDYYVPIFVSAKTGQRVDRIFDVIDKVYENASRRIPTGILNDVIREAVSVNEPPSPSGRRLKILYATQTDVNPPKIVIFVNNEKILHFSYRRYLENSLRKAFDFSGTPIVVVYNSKKEE